MVLRSIVAATRCGMLHFTRFSVALGALVRCSLPLTLIIALLLNTMSIYNLSVITCNPLLMLISVFNTSLVLYCILNGLKSHPRPKKRTSLTVVVSRYLALLSISNRRCSHSRLSDNLVRFLGKRRRIVRRYLPRRAPLECAAAEPCACSKRGAKIRLFEHCFQRYINYCAFTIGWQNRARRMSSPWVHGLQNATWRGAATAPSSPSIAT
jgi:hypothetical protein